MGSRGLLAVVLGCAGVLTSGRGNAAQYVWDGGAGDGLWSSAANWNPDGVPGKDDDVVFNMTSGSATVDVDFAGEVLNLTLLTGYSGTVRLERELIVAMTLRQEAGTITCGSNDLHLGPKSRTVNVQNYPAKLELLGGTFNAPSGVLRVYSKNAGGTVTMTGGHFNANGGRFVIAQHTDINRAFTMRSVGNTFYDFELEDMMPGEVCKSAPRIRTYGTNTVLHAFRHKWGNFWGTEDYNQSRQAGYTSLFRVRGDVYSGGNAAGGGAVLLLDGTGDQAVHGDETGAQCTTLIVDKPSGKVTFDGDTVAFGDNGVNTFYGFKVLSQTEVDMSALRRFYVTTYNYRPFHLADGMTLKAPAVLHVRNGSQQGGAALVARDQTFNDLVLESGFSWFYLPNHYTNTVVGTLTVTNACSVGCARNAEFDANSTVPGALIVKGDIVSNAGTGGNCPFIVCGEGDQTFVTRNGGRLNANLSIRKDAESRVVVDSDCDEFKIGRGTAGEATVLVEGGILDFSGKNLIFENCQNLIFKEAGGQILTGQNEIRYSTGCLNNHIGPIATPIHALTVDSGNAWFAFDGTVTITNRFSFSGSYIAGAGVPNLQGDVVFGQIYGTPRSGWTGALTFTGDQVQTFSCLPGSPNTYGRVTVDKAGGKLVLASDFCVTNDATCNGGYEQFDWTRGTIDLNGHDLCLGSYPHIEAAARAEIPAGSHLRVKGNLKDRTSSIDIKAGATLAFEIPVGEQDEPMVQIGTSLPQRDPFNLEVLPTLRPEAPKTWKVLSYGGKLTEFDAAKWHVTGPESFRRPVLTHAADDRLVLLNWKYRMGVCVIVR